MKKTYEYRMKDREWAFPRRDEHHDRDVKDAINVRGILFVNTGSDRNTPKSKPVRHGNSLESSAGRMLAMAFEDTKSLAQR